MAVLEVAVLAVAVLEVVVAMVKASVSEAGEANKEVILSVSKSHTGLFTIVNISICHDI